MAEDAAVAAPEHAVSLVSNALQLAREEGQSMTWAALREETELGGDDLRAAVEHLQVSDQVSEVTPGAFRWRQDGDVEEDVPDEAEVGATEVEPTAERPAAGTPVDAATARGVLEGMGLDVSGIFDPPATEPQAAEPGAELPHVNEGRAAGVEVVLPPAVANALDVTELGKIVASGIAEAKARSVTFRLVVTPEVAS